MHPEPERKGCISASPQAGFHGNLVWIGEKLGAKCILTGNGNN